VGLLRIALAILVLPAPLAAQTTLILKSGQEYDLKGPAKVRNGVMTFTTTDGHFLSIKQSDILREIDTPAADSRKQLSSSDARELGEIARQGRAEKGVSSPVDPKPHPARPAATPRKKPPKKGAPKKAPASPKDKSNAGN
jgi:hypothetical protein